MRSTTSYALLLVAGLTSPVANGFEPVTEGDVSYVSGGVGLEERTEMKALAPQYNLHVMFSSEARGAYLADVTVSIKDAHGQDVLQTRSDGPGCYAQLPAGTYKVNAEQGESSMSKTAIVGRGKPAILHFNWR